MYLALQPTTPTPVPPLALLRWCPRWAAPLHLPGSPSPVINYQCVCSAPNWYIELHHPRIPATWSCRIFGLPGQIQPHCSIPCRLVSTFFSVSSVEVNVSCSCLKFFSVQRLTVTGFRCYLAQLYYSCRLSDLNPSGTRP